MITPYKRHPLPPLVALLTLDGTGYGLDGHVWGGEVLVGDYVGFERAAHLAYVRMPGGALAILEPWRMAVSYLAHHFGNDLLRLRIPFVEHLSCRRVEILLRMIERGVAQSLPAPVQ